MHYLTGMVETWQDQQNSVLSSVTEERSRDS